jgi:hypothetical protein
VPRRGYDAETVSDWPRPHRARTQPAVSACQCLLAAILACTVAVLSGCGSSSPTVEKTAEAQVVALANAICRESNDLRATGATVEAHRNTERARLRALAHTARKVPPLSRYLSDLAARRRLRTEMRKLSRKEGNVADAFSLLDESYRLEVKTYADKRTLGLTSCIGPPPKPPIKG